MLPTNPIPWPTRWRRSPTGFSVCFMIFFGVAAAICIAAGFLGFPVAALWTPLFAGFALATVAMGIGVRRRSARSVRTRLQPDGLAALMFPYSLRLTVAISLEAVGLVTVGTTFLAAELLGALGGDAEAWFGVAVLGLTDLLGLASLYGIARRRLVRGAVFLSPTGVVHRTWGADTAIGWDEVFAVTPEERTVATAYGNGPPAQLIRLTPYANATATYLPRSLFWRPLRKQADHTPLISGTVLGVNPALVYHTLRFYHRHPDARAELGTDAAVRRVRAGQVLYPEG